MNKAILCTVFLLVFFGSAVVAQFQYQYGSSGISCGNGTCEAASLRLKAGEEKTVSLAGKTYSIKVLEIGAENKVFVSINNEPKTLIWETREKYGLFFQFAIDNTPETAVSLTFEEANYCAVPDCAFKIETNLYKNWNLVPISFLGGAPGPQSGDPFKKGTCQPSDFTVIYGFDPIQKEYAKFFSYGNTPADLSSKINNFQRPFESSGILAGTFLNSAWVFSRKECKLVAELPNELENILLLFEKTVERINQQNQYPTAPPGQPVPAPQPPSPLPRFAAGWNFGTGSKDMEGKSFDEIKGNCIIEKASKFNAQNQSWEKIETAPGASDNFLFKVTEPCLFGLPEEPPPELPP